MNAYVKLSAAAVIAALAALTLRRREPELAMLAVVAGCCICGGLLLEIISPILSFSKRIYEKTGLAPELLSPLMKSAGIGIVTQISASICLDAGESAMARLAELGGVLLCLYVSLPLLSAVLDLIGRLAGEAD